MRRTAVIDQIRGLLFERLKHICQNLRVEQLGPEEFMVSFEARTMAEAALGLSSG
jgi:hypothetical protein